jgi:hypothetical protein
MEQLPSESQPVFGCIRKRDKLENVNNSDRNIILLSLVKTTSRVYAGMINNMKSCLYNLSH